MSIEQDDVFFSCLRQHNRTSPNSLGPGQFMNWQNSTHSQSVFQVIGMVARWTISWIVFEKFFSSFFLISAGGRHNWVRRLSSSGQMVGSCTCTPTQYQELGCQVESGMARRAESLRLHPYDPSSLHQRILLQITARIHSRTNPCEGVWLLD